MQTRKDAAVREHGGARRGGAGNSHPRDHYRRTDRRAQGPAHGHVVGDTWRKRAWASEHMLRNPEGWALDIGDLNLAESAGARWVVIEEQEHGVCYLAPVERIRSKGEAIDRGHGAQLLLRIAQWTTDGRKCASSGAVQLGLFEAHDER